ncbi:FtsW/RodA/SpoVE family cell cycle protein [Thermocrinis sp.]
MFVDKWIAYSVILLFIMGEVAIISSNVLGVAEFKYETFRRPFLQMVAFIFGFFLANFISKTDYRKFFSKKIAYFFIFLSLLLLTAVLIKKTVTGKPVDRWLIGKSVQPLEFLKICVIIFLAYYVADKGSLRNIKWILWAFLLIFSNVLLLTLQPDIGGAIFVLILSLSIMYVGGIPYKLYFPLLALTFLFSYNLLKTGYISQRISAWIDPFAEAEEEGYQIIQSLYAFAKGGLFGVGIGKGIQKMGVLPESDTDYVMSVIGEELGFVGVMLVLCLYSILLGRLFYYSVKITEPFGKLIVFGIAMNFSLAFLWNLAMATNLIPPKGIALPFVSYGLSNITASIVMIGLAQSVIRVWHTERTFSTLMELRHS